MKKVITETIETVKGAWSESRFLTAWTFAVALFFCVWFSHGFYVKITDTQFSKDYCEVGGGNAK